MGKPHEQRKAEIIHSALSLAAEVGVSRVTTQAIADRVGIAQATIFRHFKTRDLIFSEAIEWLAGQFFNAVSNCFDSRNQAADARLKQLIKQQLAFIAQHKGLPRLLFSDRLHIESPPMKAVVRNIMSRYTHEVANLIDEGVVQGCFHQKTNTQQSATMIVALIQGTVMRWSIFDFSFKLEDEAEPIQHLIMHVLQA